MAHAPQSRKTRGGVRRAILIVDHGSRRPEATAQLEALADRVRIRAPDVVVQTAHLEIAAPDIAAGIEACVAAGAGEIIVQPFFLAAGVHTTRDIPAQVAAAASRHPGLRVGVTAPLGPHEKLVDIVLERSQVGG